MPCIVCVDESGNLTANNLSGTNTGDQTITLTGDVTGSGTGSFSTTIANDAVTYAKMQDVSAASKLLGRGSASGAGNVEEISLGTGLALSGTTLNVTSGSPYAVSRQTWTTDTALAGVGSGGTRISNSFTLDIPSSGIIRVSMLQGSLRSANTGGDGGAFALGIEVNSSTTFGNIDSNTIDFYGPAATMAPSHILTYTGQNCTPNHPLPYVALDIETLGISTGTRTCYIRGGSGAAYGYGETVTFRGSSVTGVFLLEVIDCS